VVKVGEGGTTGEGSRICLYCGVSKLFPMVVSSAELF